MNSTTFKLHRIFPANVLFCYKNLTNSFHVKWADLNAAGNKLETKLILDARHWEEIDFTF